MIQTRWCVLLLLLSAAASPAQEGATDKAPTPAFRFAWPVPSSALVTKDGEKKGEKARIRFRLEVAPDTGTDLRARMVDFEFLQVNGRDATTPEVKASLAGALALTQAVPDIIATTGGRYLRVDGFDAMIERVAKFSGDQKGQTAEQRERTLKNMRSPMMQEALQQACGSDWNTWAGAWVGFDATPGNDVTAAVEMPFMGAQLPARVTRRHHGEVAEHPDHVRLSSTTLSEGPEATAALAAAMQRVTEQTGEKPFPKDELESVRCEMVMEVVTDPRTLLPLRANRTKTIRIAMKGEVREQGERNEYTFVWAPAAGGR